MNHITLKFLLYATLFLPESHMELTIASKEIGYLKLK